MGLLNQALSHDHPGWVVFTDFSDGGPLVTRGSACELFKKNCRPVEMGLGKLRHTCPWIHMQNISTNTRCGVLRIGFSTRREVSSGSDVY